MLQITETVSIPEEELEFSAIRAGGPGGQNVNKVSSAIHLRFDIMASSLPEDCKQLLLKRRDKRVNNDGVVVMKAQRFRSQEKNREDARTRLVELIRAALVVPMKRKRTRPTRASRLRRLDTKGKRSKLKSLRRKVES